MSQYALLIYSKYYKVQLILLKRLQLPDDYEDNKDHNKSTIDNSYCLPRILFYHLKTI